MNSNLYGCVKSNPPNNDIRKHWPEILKRKKIQKEGKKERDREREVADELNNGPLSNY